MPAGLPASTEPRGCVHDQHPPGCPGEAAPDCVVAQVVAGADFNTVTCTNTVTNTGTPTQAVTASTSVTPQAGEGRASFAERFNQCGSPKAVLQLAEAAGMTSQEISAAVFEGGAEIGLTLLGQCLGNHHPFWQRFASKPSPRPQSKKKERKKERKQERTPCGRRRHHHYTGGWSYVCGDDLPLGHPEQRITVDRHKIPLNIKQGGP